jgi:DNA-binding MarR family transcriptional regulator
MISVVSIEMSDLVGPLLGRAHDRLRTRVDAALAEHELHARQFGALVVLASHGPMSQRRLGSVQGVDRTTTVAVLDHLQSRGLIERRRDPADRRVHTVSITDEGRQVLRSAGRAVVDAEREVLEPLGADAERLKGLLRRLIDEPVRA